MTDALDDKRQRAWCLGLYSAFALFFAFAEAVLRRQDLDLACENERVKEHTLEYFRQSTKTGFRRNIIKMLTV